MSDPKKHKCKGEYEKPAYSSEEFHSRLDPRCPACRDIAEHRAKMGAAPTGPRSSLNHDECDAEVRSLREQNTALRDRVDVAVRERNDAVETAEELRKQIETLHEELEKATAPEPPHDGA